MLNKQKLNKYQDLAESSVKIIKSLNRLTNSFELNNRNERVLIGFFVDNKSYEDIAKEEGVSKERIRQLIDKVLMKIRLLDIGNDIDVKNSKIDYLKRKNKELDIALSKIKLINKELDAILNRNAVIDEQIDDLGLSVRAYNVLKAAKLTSLSDIHNVGISELRRFRNMGKNTVNEIKEMLLDRGLTVNP